MILIQDFKKRIILLGVILINSLWSKYVFSQRDTLINQINYVNNESLILDTPPLHREKFRFINLNNYSEVYLIQTLGENTSMKYYLISDSLVERIEFKMISPIHYDFRTVLIPILKLPNLISDSSKFSYTINDPKSSSYSTEKWIQHIKKGEILSGLYWTNYTDTSMKNLKLDIIQNFVDNILLLEEYARKETPDK